MRTPTIETILFWHVYDELGIHPDEEDIDTTSKGALIKSLNDAGIDFDESEIPETATIETLTQYIETLVYQCPIKDKDILNEIIVNDGNLLNLINIQRLEATPALHSQESINAIMTALKNQGMV